MTIDIDEAKVGRNEFGLWLGWTLATAGGMLVGFLLSIPLVNLLNLGFAQIAVPVLAGTVIGFAQWFVLRRYLTVASPWDWTDGISWAVGYILGLFLIQVLPSTIFAAFIGYFLFGVIVAVVQWPVLRREIPQIFTWIVASALAWAVGYWVSQAVLSLFFTGDLIEPAVGTAVNAITTGLVAGAITGLALIWIVRKPEIVYET
jgi:hypothetical protein